MINLLSFEEKKKIRSDYHLRVFSVFLPLFSVVLLVAIVSLFPSYFFAIGVYKKIFTESQSASVVNKQSQEKEITIIVKDTNEKIRTLKEFISDNNAEVFFEEILQARNSGVTLTGFTYDSGVISANTTNTAPQKKIFLSGISANRENIQSFVNELKQNKSFDSVDLPISSLVNESDFPYVVNIVVKD